MEESFSHAGMRRLNCWRGWLAHTWSDIEHGDALSADESGGSANLAKST